MRLDSKSGVRGMLINAETGQPIRWVRWADVPDHPEQQGDFEAFTINPDDAKARGIPLADTVYRGRCRMRFVPAAPRFASTPTSQRDLNGSLEDARRRLVQPKLLVPGEECDEPGCHRLSAFRVSDEVEIEPQRDAEGRQLERAVATRIRSYCDKHYRLPTFTSTRGVQSEVEIEEARPQ
jgi:hypothetical protein